MTQRVDASDGELARAVSAQTPGAAEAAETELYRRFAPRVRLYGLATCATRRRRAIWFSR